MNANHFLANLGYIANAPGGVGRLRDLVYHFAFSGELVAHSRDNAADLAEALARAEKRTRRIRPSAVEASTGYHSIPSHWRWVNIGLIGHDWGQTKPAHDFTYIDVSAIDNQRGIVADGATIVPAANAPSRARKIVKKGTVIYSTVRPYLLNIAVIELDFDPAPIASTAFAVLHPHKGVEAKFVYYFLRSPAFVAYVESVQSGIAYPAISDQKFFAASFPLAPTEEQKRIVVRVGELMALCNLLDEQQQERERFFPILSRTCHSRFADAPSPANLNRIFDEVGTVSPADLRNTILTLAVQGNLVPQNPNDEPAETLNSKLPNQLRAIAEKVGAKFSAPAGSIEGSEDVPAGWGVAAIQSIGITQTGTTPSKSESRFTGRDIPFIKPGDIQGDEVDYENEGLSEEGLDAGRLIPKNSVLMVSIGGSIGKTAIVDRDVSCNQQINSISPAECTEPRFVLAAIRSGDFQNEVMNRAAQGTLPIISKSKWETIRIPIPPLAEQRRIVAKTDQLMALVDHLEAQLLKRDKLAETFAKVCVASFTGTTNLEKRKKMKAPKTELVSVLTISEKRKVNAEAPLAMLLSKQKGELPAKVLWQQSGLPIDTFYQQLKIEIAQGWIAAPKEAEMKVVEET